MRACATASGGVMFFDDDVQRECSKSKSVRYEDLAGNEKELSSRQDSALRRLEAFGAKIAAKKSAA